MAFRHRFRGKQKTVAQIAFPPIASCAGVISGPHLTRPRLPSPWRHYHLMPARGGTKPNTASVYGNCPTPVAAKQSRPNGAHRLLNRALPTVSGKQQNDIRNKEQA
jgi:hypothetical protein